MLDVKNEICPCGKPLVQSSRQKRRYCNDACKQAAYRKRQEARAQTMSPQALARLHELEQEVTRYRDLLNRVQLEGKFMALGELLQYRALLMPGILGGVSYWQAFMERADTETLIRAIAAAEAFYENLTAPRLEHQAKRIAELEEQVRKLQEQLNIEARYLVDTEARHFKAWLRKRTFPEGSFAQWFLADRRFKPQASRATYEAQLKAWGYSEEDIQTFRDLWKAMLLQS